MLTAHLPAAAPPSLLLPTGFIFEPYYVRSFAHIQAPLLDPILCTRCSSHAADMCEMKTSTSSSSSTSEWRCLFCEEWNPIGLNAPKDVLAICDTLAHQGGAPIKHTVLCIDVNALTKHSIAPQIISSLQACPDDLHISLVLFGSCVLVCELGGLKVQCECLPGDSRPSQAVERLIQAHETDERFNVKFVTPLHMCRESVEESLLAFACEEEGSVHMDRCLAVAVETCLLLLNAVGAPCGNVVVISGGPCTKGPGRMALEWDVYEDSDLQAEADRKNAMALDIFKDLRAQCVQARVAVDTFCVGHRSGKYGVRYLCELGRVTMTCNSPSLLASITREPPCSVNVKLSEGLESDVLCEPLDDFVEEALTVFVKLGSGRRRRSNPAVQVAVTASMERLGLVGTGEATRTLTKAAVIDPTTTTLPADEQLVALLIAKQSLVLGTAEDAKKHIKLAVKHAAKPFLDSSKRLPSTVVRLAVLLFHFYRGPMLDAHAHPEVVQCLRARFIHAGVEAGLRMMQPNLFGLRWNRGVASTLTSLNPMPLSTLSLRRDYVLVLDDHADVFVWYGRDVPLEALERQVASEFADKLVINAQQKQRWPVPAVTKFEDTSSMARFLRARLSPEHKDEPNAQMQAHSHLQELSADQLAKFRLQLWNECCSDDMCFAQWFAGVGL
jgi:hypothetical protein